MKSLIGRACIIKTKPGTVYHKKNGQHGIIINYSENHNNFHIFTVPKDIPIEDYSKPITYNTFAFKPDEFELLSEKSQLLQ